MKARIPMPALIFTLILLGLAGGAAWAETLYVQRTKVDIKQGRGAYYPTVFSAQKGDALEVIGQEGGWYQVKTPKGPGWVFGQALAPQKAKSPGPLASLVGKADTSELDKTAGFKGFDRPTEEAYVSKNNLQAQIQIVDRLQQPPFTLAELETFQKTGVVGPMGGGR